MEQNSVLALEGGKTSRNERGFAPFIRGENVERLCRRRVGHSNKLEARLLARDGLLRWKKSAQASLKRCQTQNIAPLEIELRWCTKSGPNSLTFLSPSFLQYSHDTLRISMMNPIEIKFFSSSIKQNVIRNNIYIFRQETIFETDPPNRTIDDLFLFPSTFLSFYIA